MAIEATGIEFIPNQMIEFDLVTEPCNRYFDPGYCQLFQFADPIYWQGNRRPCGANLMCDPSDPTIIGSELVPNWDFSAGTDWTLFNCAIGGGVLAFTGNPLGAGAGQNIPITGGRQYYVEVICSSYTSGTLGVTGLDDQITSAGTFGGYINTLDADTVIIMQLYHSGIMDPFIGDITSVSIKEVERCYNGEGWSYDSTDGFFYHESGVLDPLVPITTPVITASTYQIQVTIKLNTVGGVTINCGDQTSIVLSENKQHTVFLYTGASTTFEIVPDIDFDGAIRIDAIYGMTEIEQAFLCDENGTEIVSIIQFLTYNQEKINIRFTWNELLAEHEGEDLGIEAGGCYRISLYDYCNPQFQQIVVNPDLEGGSGTTSPVDWFGLSLGATISWTSDQFSATITAGGQSPRFRNVTPLILEDGVNYQAKVEIVSIDPGIIITMSFDNGVYVTGSLTTPGIHTLNIPVYDIDNYVDGFLRVFVTDNGGPYNATGVVTRVTMIRIEPFEQEYLSGCFKVAESWPCTRWIEAYNDCSAFGFDFNGFRFGMRIPMKRFNPSFPFKDNTYVYSSGIKKRTNSERDKKYEVKTGKIDDIAHSCLSLALLCDHLLISDSDSDVMREYFFDDKEYQPIWQRDGRRSTAMVRFELSSKDSVVYNNACDVCTPPADREPCAEYCEEDIVGTWDGVSAGAVVGWHLVDDSPTLAYWNGSAWTSQEIACESGIALHTDGTPYYWTGTEWRIWIRIDTISNSGTDLSVTYVIPAGAYGRLETSINGGTTWVPQGVYRSASIWLAGTDTYTAPVSAPDSFDVRIKVNIDGCVYYSAVTNYTMT